MHEHSAQSGNEGNAALQATADIVCAYVGNPSSHIGGPEGLSKVISMVFGEVSKIALGDVSAEVEAPAAADDTRATKAQIKKSVTPDALISFVDNKPYKTLRRHLTRHGMTMDDYRQRYGLPNDYPAVAPNYSAARSEMARKLGLGRGGRKGAAQASGEAAPAKTGGRGRKAAS